MSTSTSFAFARFMAAPEPTAITSTSIPVSSVKIGNNSAKSPESRIEVVVAKRIV